MPGELFIGLMSGTSMDGIDAALVDLSGSAPMLVASLVHPWPDEQRQALRSLASGGPCSLAALGALDAACGNTFADAATALLAHAGCSPTQVRAIGSHGQTLHHAPDGDEGFSLQVGDPNRIAERTGITTVGDFRRRDIAAGGQGAPLVPAFHRAYLGDPTETRAVLNIGGIANLTLMPPQGEVIGFDTGPGNCLLDGWIQRQLGKPFDQDGAWAASGRADKTLVEQLLSDPYFGRLPPKSTGTQYFSLGWLDRHLETALPRPPADVQASLANVTVLSIADALRAAAPDTRRLLVCGGGRHNRVLIRGLAEALPQLVVEGTDTHGLDPDHVESMAFAWLARQTLAGRPGNLPAVTGARHPVPLGAVYPA